MVLSKKVALTIDLEEWTVPEDFGSEPVPEAIKLNIARQGLNRILNILTTENVKATFFVTTYFANHNSRILRKMLEAGHEIENHGLQHVRKPQLTLKEEVERIEESTNVIEEVTGVRPCGYREPYLAITKGTIAALMHVGYAYDSSVMGTWLPNKNQWMLVPSTPFIWKHCGDNLVELPLSVFPKLRVPAGWWWLRKNLGNLIPLATASLLFQLSHPFITNVHTWELAELPQNYEIPFHIRYNCGRRSFKQIQHLIVGLKRFGAEFVLMKTIAEEEFAEAESDRARPLSKYFL
ncbi:MAG: polysaccharide deacetylase family protein [Candidatus Bathyarchaeia archaeon]|jgi:peptidoglycan/xylan/chitin deacetylase (PgdA/CDA1 family)